MIEYLIKNTICQNQSTLNRLMEAVPFFRVSWEGHGRLQCRHNGRAMPWEDPVLALVRPEPDGIGDVGPGPEEVRKKQLNILNMYFAASYTILHA